VSDPEERGRHLREYLAEVAGTMFMVLVGLSAVVLNFGTGSPTAELIPNEAARRLLTGATFAGAAAVVAYSPLGMRSGGHLNPAVTLAFHRLGKVGARDAVGYLGAQLAGASLGAVAVALLWTDRAESVNLGVTGPGTAGRLAAFGAEVAMTFVLVTVILHFVDRVRVARLTPLVAGAVAALFVMLLAPVSGTSLNPARSAGPAVVLPRLTDLWIYLTAPVLGALAAAELFGRVRGRPRCAKLVHPPRGRPCHFIDCAYRREAREEQLRTAERPGDSGSSSPRGRSPGPSPA
jgi:aquaporin Z